jgi:hypothetical protein
LDNRASLELTAGKRYLVDVVSVYRTGAAKVTVNVETPDGIAHHFIRLHPRVSGTPVGFLFAGNHKEHLNPYGSNF